MLEGRWGAGCDARDEGKKVHAFISTLLNSLMEKKETVRENTPTSPQSKRIGIRSLERSVSIQLLSP